MKHSQISLKQIIVVIFCILITFKENFKNTHDFKTNNEALIYKKVTIHGETAITNSFKCTPGLIFFKSYYQNFSLYETQNAKIQKTIHLFAKSNCITPEIHENIEAWKSTKHSIELHSLGDIKAHIFNVHEKFPSAKNAWKCAVTHEARLDLARFIFLYDFGGVSTDIDTIPTNETFATLYHNPSHEYISEALSKSSNLSLTPRIIASCKNNAILYANFLSSTALQYRQHVYNKTNFKSYERSRWDIYGSWQWKDRYVNYGFVVFANVSDSKKFLRKVEFSKESKEILSLKEETDGCVNFNTSVENQASEELFSLIESNTTKNDDCGNEKLFYIKNVYSKNSFSFTTRKIPKIIHMTAKTKCITAHVKNYVDEWRNIPNYSFFLHDDDAVERLFEQYEWPEFPLLKKIKMCISNGAMKADLWRYLLLWKFGGVYTDLDNGIGKNFNNASFITDEMDALFEVEKGRFPSQYFFAVSPGHPLMYFALSISIEKMMNHAIYRSRQTMFITGPAATKYAMIAHTHTKNGYLSAGVYKGKANRNVTFIGSKYHAQHKLYIKRDVAKDLKEGHLMKMDHYITNAKNISNYFPKHSCRRELVSKMG